MNTEKAIARIVMILFNVEHDILRWICSTKVGTKHNASRVVEEGSEASIIPLIKIGL